MKGVKEHPRPALFSKMRRLEQKLAYDHCVAVLRAFCPQAENADKEVAFDLASNATDESTRSLVTEAVQYLEWRGLLDRAVEAPSWVVVLAEEKGEVAA
jgi:hypothetical protein